MPPKRKVRESPKVEITQKRVTRSAAASGNSSAIGDVGDLSSPRKKHRGLSHQVEIKDDREFQTPKRKRVYGRSATKLSNALLREKLLEDSDVDELNVGSGSESSQCNHGKDSPRKIRRRVVFDSVEIVTARKANIHSTIERRTPITPASATTRSSMKRSLMKASSSPTFSPDDSKSTISMASRTASRTLKDLPRCLPTHLHECLENQKQAILDAFQDPPLVDHQTTGDVDDENESSANAIALHQLGDLLGGSIVRGEGNSCLVIGPAGSGKSKIFEMAMCRYEEDYQPIVIRLNGHVQHTDRLAIREIARQVVEQTGSKTFESIGIEDDDNPFDDGETSEFVGALPPPSHLPSLIAALPTLSRPVVVLLDAFNIFTEQPRQALLYCLLDTVQSCRPGSPSHRGLAVVGLTSRIDVINFLEKRVKSRFSHRMFRTASMQRSDAWMGVLKDCLCSGSKKSATTEWRAIWEHSVNTFLQDRSVSDILRDMFGISRDIRGLLRAMANSIVRLSPNSPYLTSQGLQKGLESQCSKQPSTLLMKLNYPSLSLCIAAQHARTAGHDSFTFEMLYELFTVQVRTSSAAPVMLGGGSIGMVSVGRRVLMGAFEELIRVKIFLQAAPPAASLSKEFIKYRCTVERDDVKAAVDRIGQTNLKKWFSKAQ